MKVSLKQAKLNTVTCIFVSPDYLKMESLDCVVDHNLKDVQYSNVTPLSENADDRLLEVKAREMRE